MGYHVTILRTDQGKQLPISLEEIISATSSIDGWRYQESPPTFEFRDEGNSCTLWFQDGELWTKNPAEWQLGVMITLANRLNARVRGDELETYRTEAESYQHPEDIEAIDAQAGVLAKYKKRAKIRHFVFRAYQLITISGLLYLAVKWLIKDA